jgi:Tfp pilus assembly protein PilN
MALREINLVPADILHRWYLFRHLALWVAGLGLVLTIIGGGYLHQIRATLPSDASATTLRDMHTQLGATIEEIELIRDEIENLSRQEEFLETLTRKQPFSRLLADIAHRMNDDTWLTRIAVSASADKKGPVQLLLNGYSVNSERLGDYLDLLSRQGRFGAVILNFVKETLWLPPGGGAGEARKIIQFQIECTAGQA